MKRFCEHCGALIAGNVYRVTSEEEGIILLDMTVCSRCFVEAKRLHLQTKQIKVRSKQTSAQHQRNHHS
jgi:ribosome-binding protein aMBF1 (putative translation factor)